MQSSQTIFHQDLFPHGQARAAHGAPRSLFRPPGTDGGGTDFLLWKKKYRMHPFLHTLFVYPVKGRNGKACQKTFLRSFFQFFKPAIFTDNNPSAFRKMDICSLRVKGQPLFNMFHSHSHKSAASSGGTAPLSINRKRDSFREYCPCFLIHSENSSAAAFS